MVSGTSGRVVAVHDDADDPVVQVGHRGLTGRADRPQQVDRRQVDVLLRHHPAAVVAVRVGPPDDRGHVVAVRQEARQPVVDRRFRLRARGPVQPRRLDARLELDPEPVGQRHAAAGRADHGRVGREALLGVRVERRGRAFGVAGQGLVSALGHGQIGERVVQRQQAVDLGADRGQLVLGGVRRQALGAERVRRVGRAGHAADQFEAVDHVPGLDHLDRGAGRRLGLRQPAGPQRERATQRGDESVQLGLRPPVVQAALEPVTQQRAERLALPQAVQHRQRLPDPVGAEVHRERPRVLGCGVGQVAGAQHSRGGRLGR